MNKILTGLKNRLLHFLSPYSRYTWSVKNTDGSRRYITKHWVFGIRVVVTNDPVQWRKP